MAPTPSGFEHANAATPRGPVRRCDRATPSLACAGLLLLTLGCAEPPPKGPQWERVQARWAAALASAGHPAPSPGVRELVPQEGSTPERCVSCHVGMVADAPPLDSEPLFRGHPAVPHSPTEFGCVACHGGDPEGLDRSQAHGLKGRSPEPLLPSALVEARCGSCHGDLVAPPGGEESALDVPTLLAGKSAFHRGGCLGCHRVGALGGRLARELTSVGRPAAPLLRFGRDLRPGSEWNKLLWHHGDPLVVVPLNALDPMNAETAARLREMQTYLLSLRGAAANGPEARGFASGGASLYAALCSACHGEDAAGRDWPGRSQWVPAVAGAGHASLAGKELLRDAIVRGRPLRGMPAWSLDRGGLTEGEIDELVDWLWSLRATAPSLEDLTATPGDAARGRQLHARSCAACHGADGRGGDFGGSLRDLDPLQAHLALTEGRPARGMPPFAALPEQDLRDLLALLSTEGSWRIDAEREPATAGEIDGGFLFARQCAGCHGPDGGGREASSLRSATWQAAVSDAQITMAILAGRPGSLTPTWSHAGDSPLSAREALALTAHVRGLRETP